MNKIKIILNFLERKYRKNINKHLGKNLDIFKILIETVLSQRTRDENTDKAVSQLFSVADTPEKIFKLPIKRLQSLIKPSGFYRQKAKNIKKICKTILKKYNGKIPKTREELLKLPGVGWKTSAIVMMYGFNKPTIAVDVHVEVCSKRLGLVSKDAKTPEIEKTLEKLISINKWYIVNLGFVMFGKEICKPVNLLCIKDSRNCPFSSFCKAYKTRKFKV